MEKNEGNFLSVGLNSLLVHDLAWWTNKPANATGIHLGVLFEVLGGYLLYSSWNMLYFSARENMDTYFAIFHCDSCNKHALPVHNALYRTYQLMDIHLVK